MMIDKIADALLCRIYHPVTAVISMDEKEAVLRVVLFDTIFGTKDCVIEPGAKKIAVVCGHPDGRIALVEADIRNIRRIVSEAEEIEMHTYIAGEDIGCFEVDIDEILGYNGENAT